MAAWKSALAVSSNDIKLLVTSAEGDDVLKARLPVRSKHPRALLTLLEGSALWSGHPIRTAISVVGAVDHSLGLGDLENLCLDESALVRLAFVEARHPRRITGLGDFRQLRLFGRNGE